MRRSNFIVKENFVLRKQEDIIVTTSQRPAQ